MSSVQNLTQMSTKLQIISLSYKLHFYRPCLDKSSIVCLHLVAELWLVSGETHQLFIFVTSPPPGSYLARHQIISELITSSKIQKQAAFTCPALAITLPHSVMLCQKLLYQVDIKLISSVYLMHIKCIYLYIMCISSAYQVHIICIPSVHMYHVVHIKFLLPAHHIKLYPKKSYKELDII